MRDYMTEPFFANWVAMLRAETDGAIWLVDDEEDARFYERLAHPSARVLPAQRIALKLLVVLRDRGIRGVVAVIEGISDEEFPMNDVFYPSTGSVSSLLIVSSAVPDVVRRICGASWNVAFEKCFGPMAERIVRLACMVEVLRSELNDVDLHLDVSTGPLIDWELMELNHSALERIWLTAGRPRDEMSVVLERARSSAAARGTMQWHGKDAISVLATATRTCRPRGISANRATDVKELVAMLGTSFPLEEFERDDMYWKMRAWERSNWQYPLLRQWRVLDSFGVLWDQRYWRADLERIVASASDACPIAVLKLDLDNFKAVNDSLGHSAGDEAIQLYLQIVKSCIAKHGETYRRGGDEVVAIIFGIERAAAFQLAESIRVRVEQEFQVWGAERGLKKSPTTSIGLVVSTGEKSIGELEACMDRSQRDAKTSGKNRVVGFS